MVFEPVITNAAEDTATVTATVSEEVTISAPTNATFSASIPGVSGNPGAPVTASLTWTVKTNNDTGFNLKIHASQTNALYKDATYFFTDHTSTPSYGWTAPGAGVASFGFTIAAATAADTVAAFLDGGVSCGAGANTGGCWSGFVTTTDISIINRTTETTSAGEAEVVNFKAESNGKLLEDGSYVATITATATLN
ncbi:hypothetical protein KKH26_00700 [Patescibacteria group bacterium]|nr:hypothetical protein [Patescibacteria group bacterium]